MNQNSDGSGGDVEGGDDPDSSSSSPSPKESVLEAFRKEWKRELESSPHHVVKSPGNAENSEPVPHNVIDKAAVYFKLGIENEEKGRMYEAIQYYKKAVQLVPDIEFHLFQPAPKPQFSADVGIHNDNEEVEVDVEDEGEDEEEFDPTKTDLLTHLQLLSLRQQERSFCVPHLASNATHISALPFEVFLYILRWVVSTDLDLRSLEMCSEVCRGFHICSRDPEIWRSACARIWGVKCGSLSLSYPSWRDMFIRRPRLQFGGCYISKTTYIRHGENSFQDQYYRPWHLVEYYRYLRFFPDGRVLMLTTPEAPAGCVGLLKKRNPPTRKPPVLTGYYRLHETIVSIVVTPESEKKILRPNSNFSESHTFHLELEILSHKKALHGQLAWRGYSIFTRRNGVEANSPFDLVTARYPPFWYSRVKSYTTETRNPLCN